MKEQQGADKPALQELPRIGDRVSFIYVEHAKVNRKDSAITVADANGIVQIPVAMIGVLLLGPGTDISHRAVQLLGETGTSIDGRKLSNTSREEQKSGYVVVDLETTGLDEEVNQIIEIGAIWVDGGQTREFQRILHSDSKLPTFIAELTGLTDEMLRTNGCDRKTALQEFTEFAGELPLVGYNVKFDVKFLERECRRFGLDWRARESIDLLTLVRKENMFLDNYKLPTVLASYGINIAVPHRALEDAKLLTELIPKLNKFEAELGRKG